MAAWLECMIGELGPSSVPGDVGGTQRPASENPLPPLSSTFYDFGNVNSSVPCSSVVKNSFIDQKSSVHSPFVDCPPKQAVPQPALGILDPTAEGLPSISQLIKDAIGHNGGAPAASATLKGYPGIALKDRTPGGLQQHKIIEDQGSSNQVGAFFPRSSAGDPPQLSNMSTLQQAVPIPSPKMHGNPSLSMQHQMQSQSLFSSVSIPPPNPASSQSSSNKVPRTGSPSPVHVQRQCHRPPQNQGTVRTSTAMVMASVSPSNSSPVSISYQDHSSPHDKEASYVHIQSPSAKRTRSQTVHECPYDDISNDENAQESGIKLVHLLMACAEAIQNDELAAAVDMVREIKRLASCTSGAMSKIASYFAESLSQRIYPASKDNWARIYEAEAVSEMLYASFYEACPYLKFAHFTANQAILEAFQGHKVVHIIDFNLMQGSQWPELIKALAVRSEGPPHLRMTGIGPPRPDNKDVLQEVGVKLAELAGSVNVEFSFRGMVAAKLDDVKPWYFEVKPGEAIAVNSILQMHRLLYGHVASDPSKALIDEVLSSIKSLNPKVVTVVEQEANHNSNMFLERFVEALHYYSTMFDSLEASSLDPLGPEMVCSEMYLGREIANIVAREGAERVERHEPLSAWRKRMSNAGFKQVHLGSNAFDQVSYMLKYFSGEGYTVEENRGCLTLGWHNRPLIAASAWECG
ncbi:hypothetical protein KP509_37G058000 [Ceratopteris richardii]|nr:hypothetical protein KP509_37G058000 [Ceratopteris richardii]